MNRQVRKSGDGLFYGVAAVGIIGLGLLVWYLMKKKEPTLPPPPGEEITPKGSITW